MVVCRSKNGYQKQMWVQTIELRAQNMQTILDSIVNMFGEDLYDL